MSLSNRKEGVELARKFSLGVVAILLTAGTIVLFWESGDKAIGTLSSGKFTHFSPRNKGDGGKVFNKDIVIAHEPGVELNLKNGKKLELLPGLNRILASEGQVEALRIPLEPLKLSAPKEATAIEQVDISGLARRLEELKTKFLASRKGQASLEKMGTFASVPETRFGLGDYRVVLVEPKNSKVLQRAAPFSLKWTSVPFSDVSYTLEIARSPKFESSLPMLVSHNSQELRLAEPGRYFWRVYARRGESTILSSTQEFRLQ